MDFPTKGISKRVEILSPERLPKYAPKCLRSFVRKGIIDCCACF